MAFKINDNGTWKTPTKFHVNDNGSWKEVQTGYINDLGVWREFYSSGPNIVNYKFGFYKNEDSKGGLICYANDKTQSMKYNLLYVCEESAASTFEIEDPNFGEGWVTYDNGSTTYRIKNCAWSQLREGSDSQRVQMLIATSSGELVSHSELAGKVLTLDTSGGVFSYTVDGTSDILDQEALGGTQITWQLDSVSQLPTYYTNGTTVDFSFG